MNKRFLGFDVERYISTIFSPYAKLFSSLVLLFTIVLSVILFVPTVRSFVNFYQWGDGVLIFTSMAWFIGVVISFVLILKLVGLSLNQFGNWFIAFDVIILLLIIVVTAIMPGQQICSVADTDCTLLDNLIWIFVILQPFILGAFLHIKFAYATGLDRFLILRKIFGPKK